MQVTLLGAGVLTPTPRRFGSAYLLDVAGRSLVVDGGPAHMGPRLDQPEVREEVLRDARDAFGGLIVFGEELMTLEVGSA